MLAAILAQIAVVGITLVVSKPSGLYNTMDPTPTDEYGMPLSAPDLIPSGWNGGVVYGDLVERDGIAMRGVTFGFKVPDTSSPAALHINSITDKRRENISFALMHPADGAADDIFVRSYLLPDDSTWTYRFVSHPDLTVDIGATRPGWLQFFSWGKPDPHNPELLPTPLDPKGISSLFTGKTARVHQDWNQTISHPASNRKSTSLVLPIDVENNENRLVTLHHRDTPSKKLLVLFDGETWRKITPHPETALGQRDYDILLIDNISLEHRSRDLPDPELVGRIVEEAIKESEKVLGRARPAPHVVLAGQSYGGLAAATLVVRRPDLALTAIAQSGSYWYQAGKPRPEANTYVQGDLLNYVANATDLTGHVIVQVGSDEQDMVTGSREFTKFAQRAGMKVDHDEWRGGHDYAWWRYGLSSALDGLDKNGVRKNGVRR